ncbi:MAG: hypothetical protein DRJ29_13295 [Bacteroidetes bacterium]|nr:MAG: hypothetical protein DRI98_13300 [Bacteroidota bacterium]RLD91873.1 MAG: hypothetical protein DRJ29_13295 [Bacteroidota bacterium]RLE01732.1 MAG: hypothetical protein DRJ13_06495 [Bacteroidota bacterium]
MKFSQSKIGSIIGGVIISIFLVADWTACLAQEGQANASEVYLQVYEATQSVLSHDPVIQNGVYYTYPYYNAIGHPFLGQKEFETASVIFRGKSYEALSINYELFSQQIILSREYDGVLQMNLLAPEFVSGFYLKGKQFIKADFQEGAPEFFQVISETPTISCYYSWYKERREVHDSGNRSIYSFSDQKSKRYLYLGEQLTRFKSNKSFLKIFPDASKALIKDYLQENQVLVLEASDQEMRSLINYCDRVLDQALNQGGE